MQFDPEVRDYVLNLFLQDLRQLYYAKGENHGTTLEGIRSNIITLFKSRGWTNELLKFYIVDENMIFSVAKELASDQYITSFVKKEETGRIFKKTTSTHFYKISHKGLEYIKKAGSPRNPLRNFKF